MGAEGAAGGGAAAGVEPRQLQAGDDTRSMPGGSWCARPLPRRVILAAMGHAVR
jgi:hypothetical protein